jgi:ribonuclease HI
LTDLTNKQQQITNNELEIEARLQGISVSELLEKYAQSIKLDGDEQI